MRVRFLLAVSPGALTAFAASEKPRQRVLTDIGGDPDDQMSIVRLMTYANQVGLEGLVATHVAGRVNPERIHAIVNAYDKVRDNLKRHEAGFPLAARLRERITQGLPVDSARTGVKHDSVGSNQPKAHLVVKSSRVMPPGPGTMHIILAVTDHGTPRLTAMRA